MAAIQQILLGMGGAGSDSYWYSLLNWGSMTGNYTNHHYYMYQGSNDDDNDDIYAAGERDYYKDGSHYRWGAYYIKLDTEGALQAQISYATAGSYSATMGIGAWVQKYSDQNYQSGSEQKYVMLSGKDSGLFFSRANTSNLNIRGQNSIRLSASDFSGKYKTIYAKKRGYRWSGGTGGGTNNEVMSAFYAAGRIIGKFGFGDSNPDAQYNQNNIAKTGENYSPVARMAVYVSFAGSAYYQTPYIRGVACEDGTDSYSGGSNNEWQNVAPFINWAYTFFTVTNANPHPGAYFQMQRNNGYGVFGSGWRKSVSAAYNDGQNQSIWASGTQCDTSFSYHIGNSHNNAGDETRGFIVKVNTSGTIQWTKNVTDNSGEQSGYKKVYFEGNQIDDDGNIYVIGFYKPSANRENAIIIKFNSNGTIAWQNEFFKTSSNSNAETRFQGITNLNSKGSLVIFGYTREDTSVSPGGSGTQANFTQGLVMKIAADGSGTGNYGNYTYSATTFGLVNHPGTWGEYGGLAFSYQSNYITPVRTYGENKDNNYTQNAGVSTTTM